MTADRRQLAAALAALLVSVPSTGILAQDVVTSRDALATKLVSVRSMVGGAAPQWSPDGTQIYFASTLGTASIWSVNPERGPPRPVTGRLSAQTPKVSPSGESITYISTKSGSPELWLWSLPSNGEAQLTNLGARINAFTWSPDGQWIAFSALRYGNFDVWKVSVSSGDVHRLTSDAAYELYPTWTPDSQQIVYVQPDDRWADHDVVIMSAAGGDKRVVTSDKDLFDYGTLGTRSKFGYARVSPDGNSVLFRSHRSGWINYWTVPLAGGEPEQVAPEDADQSDARWSPDGQHIAYVSNRNGTHDVRVVPASGGSPQVVVPVSLGVAASPAWSPGGKRLTYTLGTPTEPSDLYVVPVGGGTPRRLTHSVSEGLSQSLLTPEKVTYRSDEFTISAYLYKPATIRTGARLPGIVFAHGGPTSQFNDTYATQPQLFAQQGYVVLMPNIRGSSGFGKTFEDANNPCWTRCDMRDVVAGAEYLKSLPYVNPDKLGITGSSYGGITSMGAVAHAPGVFQASAPQSGYADWISFQEYNAELQHTKLLAYEWGPYPDSAAVYRRNSAIFSVKDVTTPVFLVHGTGDVVSWRPGRVPIRASAEFALALEKEFKVVRYKTYPDVSYYVRVPENYHRMSLDILGFFDQYLKDDVGPAPVDATLRR